MDKAPELKIGDKVIVYIRRKEEPRLISAIVNKIGKNNCVWEYNYGTPEPFFYSDVQYVEKKGKWRRL